MRVLRAATAALLLGSVGALTGCAHGGTHPLPASPSATTPHSTSSAPSTHEIKIRLAIDKGSQPTKWPTVIRFPYGRAINRLGFKNVPGLNPFVPTAAVVDDRGIWVADPVKRRIAHFSMTGKFLGQISGLSEVAGDMAEAPDGRIVEIDDGADGVLKSLRPGAAQLSAPIHVSLGLAPGDDPLFRLIPTDTALGMWSSLPHPLTPALQIDRQHVGFVHEGRNFTISVDRPVVHIADSPAWSDNLTFVAPRVNDLFVVVDSIQIHQSSIYMWVLANDDTLGHARSGEFFLQLGPSGQVEALTKVAPSQGSVVPNVNRNLLLGRDGTVYQWYVDSKGAELRRRP
jgi:hypothetical protein